MRFVHLCLHSNFSLLSGTRPVEDIVAAAAAGGCEAAALTDTDGLYAVVPFEKACREAGIRPVYGVELTGEWDADIKTKATLLARNREGYSELCRLVTSRKLDDDFSLPRALESISENLYLLSADGRIIRRMSRFENLRVPLPTAWGRDFDTVRWNLRAEAGRLGVKTVAAGDVFFVSPGEYPIHRVLTAIRTRTTVGTIPRGEAADRSAFLRTAAQVRKVFGGDECSFAEASRIAADCRVELDLGGMRLPRFRTPPGEEAASMLGRIALAGLRERLKDRCPPGEWREAMEKLEYELSVINGKGLADYFLICWDIVRFARSRGMRSLGRGSAGNSLVSFALGITHVNPMRHNMFFERFLNPGRRQLPDFDIDFATDDREEVLAYIFRRYGGDRVAMIGTYSTLRARAALRETAKAIGIPEGEVDGLIKRIPFYASIEGLEKLPAVSPAAAGLGLDREPFSTLLPVARRIGGFPRHMATHPCGLVISPGPISDLMPLQRGDKGYEITQWSMYEVEEAGLLKIDIIGQKGLAVIEESQEMASRNEGRPLHPARIDYLHDPETKALLREGRTEGCFYIESPVMMQLMRQARCDDFEVLTALSSIIRPGVSSHGGKRSYLHRQLGLEPVEPLHPAVEEVLSDTHGCLIYQEQVIRIAVAVAGMSYSEADGLRRCMSFKSLEDETMSAYMGSFLEGAAARGIDPECAREIFRRIASFAGYAFCKAHSASFALESFESAWWKAHYPAEFMAAVLSNGGGYYTQEEYVEEARRIGLKILPPCVNESGIRHHGRGRALRIGLMQVKGLTSTAMERIVAERPFRSLAGFVSSTGISAGEAQSLIKCGAMASFGRSRPGLMWELKLLGAAERSGAEGAARAAALARRIPPLPEYDLPRRIEAEREVLGICVSAHPLDIFADRLSRPAGRRRPVSSASIGSRAGEEIEIVGWRVTAKATRTSDGGEEMIFVTFSDRSGRFEAIFFPQAYRRSARELARGRGPFLIRGRVEVELGVASVVAGEAVFLGG